MLVVFLTGCDTREPVRATLSVSETLAASDTAGFARVTEPREFRFPEDHGPHPDYLHEWWYFTGNLEAEDGRPFGFQVTFFRSGLGPKEPEVDSPWATRQAYMGHFALADIAAEEFHAFERFERGALGLAGAETEPPRVWIGDWIAQGSGADLPVFTVRAAENDVAVNLRLEALRPRVLQGDEGLSRKGPEPGNASYYYSFTRMAASGEIRVEGEPVAVRGSAWLDREWGTSALAPGLAGWDWFSLQLDSGEDLMVYRLREDDGGTAPFSAGTLVTAEGATVPLDADAFTLEETGSWTSDAGVRYPSGWRIRVPGHALDLRVQPRLRDQELDLTFRYWEGAVTVDGESDGTPVTGVGYVELTGYADSPAPRDP